MLLEELSHHSIQGLRVFAYVSLLGSVTEAAEALKLSQPAVSLQLSNLEKHLGFPLFKKQGRRNALTPQGQSFLNRLLPQLEKLEQILTDAKTELNLVRPSLELGSMQGIGEYWLIDKILQFQKTQPQLHIQLEVNAEANLRQMLETGKIALAVTPSKIEHARTISRVLIEEKFVPVGTEKAIEKLRSILSQADRNKKFWLQVDWVAHAESGAHDPWAQRWLEHNDLVVTKHFEFRHQVNSYSLVKKILMAGDTVCVLPLHVCSDELKTKKLVALQSERFQPLLNRLYVSYREKSLNTVHKAFRDLLLESTT